MVNGIYSHCMKKTDLKKDPWFQRIFHRYEVTLAVVTIRRNGWNKFDAYLNHCYDVLPNAIDGWRWDLYLAHQCSIGRGMQRRI